MAQGYMVQSYGYGIDGSEFRIQGEGYFFRVYGLGFRV